MPIVSMFHIFRKEGRPDHRLNCGIICSETVQFAHDNSFRDSQSNPEFQEIFVSDTRSERPTVGK